MAYLAHNSGGIFGPVGSELGKILAARSDLTPEVRAIVDRAGSYNDYAPMDPYRPDRKSVV